MADNVVLAKEFDNPEDYVQYVQALQRNSNFCKPKQMEQEKNVNLQALYEKQDILYDKRDEASRELSRKKKLASRRLGKVEQHVEQEYLGQIAHYNSQADAVGKEIEAQQLEEGGFVKVNVPPALKCSHFDPSLVKDWFASTKFDKSKTLDEKANAFLAKYAHEPFGQLLLLCREINLSNAQAERVFSKVKWLSSGRRSTMDADLIDAYLKIQFLGAPLLDVPVEFWENV